MRLYQFCQMPFGLTGAPSSFQQLMDSVFHGLPFVTTYIDDVLIHCSSEMPHKEHLRTVFQRLLEARLTLQGRKSQIGTTQVNYLGHVFTGAGMQPDSKKVSSVQDWPAPTDVTTLQQFIDLASYYRRYIKNFAEIASPLHNLTQKNVPFVWTETCATAFTTLKSELTQAPILVYSQFRVGATLFVVQTDASAVGLGAVLEQVIAYASRALSKSECNYSTIQKECLAIVFTMKQFRHYLLGYPFTLMTDHAPLQWLSTQKMEGLFCKWALALQEYTFTIVHRKGVLNGNADALSCQPPDLSPLPAAVTSTTEYTIDLQQAQLEEPIL